MFFVKFNCMWWQYDETTPKDDATLFGINGTSINKDITNCEIVEAKSFQDLNWKNTKVWDDKYSYGWLDRKGVFYGCDYEYHEKQAYLVHKTDSNQLEKLGWIHISKISKNDTYYFASFHGDYKEGVLPTEQQMEYLIKHNLLTSSIRKAYENGNREKARKYEEDFIFEK